MTVDPERLREITGPPVLAVLATVNPDGTAQATPVWYEYDGQTLNVTSFVDRVKVRNVRRNPSVALVVVDTVSYGEALIVRGTAEIVEEGARETTQRLAIRYQGEQQGRVSAARMGGQPRVIIRITPERLLYEGDLTVLAAPTLTREDITG